ncbi:MarR family winged helix-turn-helix transcriptional regulator [Azohydromonas sediminis]|uniref:MarR family winged helix-turn-helix transcriptional regulator n=1 Tax=Azohydromonas sediminis TaxID=2259674 RepID=UPI000E65BD52|nr:MarR family transcriptional regulator [Azohydromonas sediminis]
MDLQQFFPYRLAVLAEAVSRAIADVYGERFDLTRDEWRVLAALAGGPMKTGDVIAHTTLDKMQVSRAVTRLEAHGLVEREQVASDRRARVLRLTPAGRALFRRIAPLARAREAFLLDALDADERRVLDRAIDKLRERARLLAHTG